VTARGGGEVGTEGQARRPGPGAGRGRATWKDLTDNVNFMATNLTGQVRNIAEGHHRRRQRRPVEEDNRGPVRGEILQLKETINTMVRSAERLRPARGEHRRRPCRSRSGTEGKGSVGQATGAGCGRACGKTVNPTTSTLLAAKPQPPKVRQHRPRWTTAVRHPATLSKEG